MIDTTMIFDGTISSAGVPTGVLIAGTQDSTNTLDFGVGRDIGAGYKLEVVVSVTVAFTGLTTLAIDFQVSSDNTNFYGIMPSEVFPVADLIVGAPIFRYTVPPNQGLDWAAGILKGPNRYYKLHYTATGAAETTGKLFSFLNMTNDRDQFTAYPKNYTVKINAGQL